MSTRYTELAELAPGDAVRVTGFGWTTRMQDVGRTGTVLRTARTRAVVALDPGNGLDAETRNLHPWTIRKIDRKRNR